MTLREFVLSIICLFGLGQAAWGVALPVSRSLPVHYQEQVGDPTPLTEDQLLELARGQADTTAITDQELQAVTTELDLALLLLEGDGAAASTHTVDGDSDRTGATGRLPGVTSQDTSPSAAALLEVTSPTQPPGLIAAARATEQRFRETKDGDGLMGKWLGTEEQALLAWMAFPQPVYTPVKLNELAGALRAARSDLNRMRAVEEGARTGAERHKVLRDAKALVEVVPLAQTEHARREAFLLQFELGWRALTPEQQAGYSEKPALSVALKARLGRLLAEAHAREQAQLELLEVQYAEERARGEATNMRDRDRSRLHQQRELAKLTLSVLQSEYETDLERERDRLQRAKTEAARLAAERGKRAAELRLELAEARRQMQALEDRVSTYEAEETIRRLPPHVIGRVRLLSAPGFWRPHYVAPCHMDPKARYDSLDPVPHSLSSLIAAGCLEPDAQGLFALYVILSTPHDKKRPRMTIPGLPSSHFWNPENASRLLQDNASGRKSLELLQETLATYADDFVALGYLHP